MILDLTLFIDKKTPVFPGDPKQEIEQVAALEKDGWSEKRLTFNSHFSTHIDAPIHMVEGKTLTDFPVEKFVGNAVVLELENPDLGLVKEGDFVFFYTGHIDKVYDADYFENNPVIGENLAQKLIDKKISIVGLDSFSPDNEPYTVHKMFLSKDILIVENLMNLKQLVGKRFQCHVLPLKIKDGDGAPCRVIATI